jgi:hypothetical protein
LPNIVTHARKNSLDCLIEEETNIYKGNNMTSRSLAIVLLAILVALILTVTGCQNEQQTTGTLEGAVIIGPIWPVERLGENRPVPPQVFEARKIIVYNESKTKALKTIDLIQIGHSSKASFSVQLTPGQYVVDITHGGIDRSGEVPKKIEIQSGQMVVVDINIDTGIR